MEILWFLFVVVAALLIVDIFLLCYNKKEKKKEDGKISKELYDEKCREAFAYKWLLIRLITKSMVKKEPLELWIRDEAKNVVNNEEFEAFEAVKELIDAMPPCPAQVKG